MNANILIVDDEKVQRDTLSIYLNKKGYNVQSAASGKEALDAIVSSTIDIIITDQKMPEMSGLDLAGHVKKKHPNISVVIITAFGSIEDAVDAMKNGVEDYITKPINLEEIDIILNKILEKRNLINENKRLKEQLHLVPHFPDIVYVSESMEEVMSKVVRAAESVATVMVTGESGTGKELVAQAIHEVSDRKDKPFIAVNCSAIPENLIESELFGHEKGSYTGADNRRIGRFEQAHGGTLFLDEIGDVPLAIQVKLLRILQERKLERVGGNETIDVDVRIIAATNRNLEKEVNNNSFRQDLYYRLNVVGIEIPPLRKRKSDIPVLVEHFIKQYAQMHDKIIHSIMPDALDNLVKYSFPGNIRELSNIIEQAVVLSRSDKITLIDLPIRVSSESKSFEENLTLKEQLAEMEKTKLWQALRETNGNKSAAGRILGISESKIRYLLKKYSE